MKSYNLPEGVRFTRTALVLPEGLMPEQWADVMDYVAAAGKAWGVWFGDGVKYGRKNFDAEFVALTLGQLDLPMHGVENFVLIADVAHDARPASFGGTVTPEHLLVVSKRCPDEAERKRWLETAEKLGLSPRELQGSIRAGKVVRFDAEKRRLSFPSPGAVRRAFLDWQAALGDSWETTWTLRDCEEVADELLPVVEFRQRVIDRAREIKTGDDGDE